MQSHQSSQRSKIHQYISERFSSHQGSRTVVVEIMVVMVVASLEGSSKGGNDSETLL